MALRCWLFIPWWRLDYSSVLIFNLGASLIQRMAWAWGEPLAWTRFWWHSPLIHQVGKHCSSGTLERCWDDTGSAWLQWLDSVSTTCSSLQITLFSHLHQRVWCHTVSLCSGWHLATAYQLLREWEITLEAPAAWSFPAHQKWLSGSRLVSHPRSSRNVKHNPFGSSLISPVGSWQLMHWAPLLCAICLWFVSWQCWHCRQLVCFQQHTVLSASTQCPMQIFHQHQAIAGRSSCAL